MVAALQIPRNRGTENTEAVDGESEGMSPVRREEAAVVATCPEAVAVPLDAQRGTALQTEYAARLLCAQMPD